MESPLANVIQSRLGTMVVSGIHICAADKRILGNVKPRFQQIPCLFVLD